MSDEKKILTSANADQEKLLNYLNGKMNDEGAHAFEKHMNDDPFMNDALEGLEEVTNKERIPHVAQQINSDLQKHIKQKKHRRNKTTSKQDQWIYLTVILLLVLTVLAFVVIKKFY